MAITQEQGEFLVRTARRALEAKIMHGEELCAEPIEPALEIECGTFVTLKINGQLRGCIGNLEAAGTIYEGVKRNAICAALHDYRFSPVSPDELKKIHIDISILSQPQIMEYEDSDDLLRKLRPGVDGVIIQMGRASATFLPQVWEQLPQPEQFLGHLCTKAGLAATAWRDSLLVKTYQVQCFAERS